jgi:hypothetical protein
VFKSLGPTTELKLAMPEKHGHEATSLKINSLVLIKDEAVFL